MSSSVPSVESIELPQMASPGPARVQFACPACGHRMHAAARHAGRAGRCPRCRAATRVPALSRPSPGFADEPPLGFADEPHRDPRPQPAPRASAGPEAVRPPSSRRRRRPEPEPQGRSGADLPPWGVGLLALMLPGAGQLALGRPLPGALVFCGLAIATPALVVLALMVGIWLHATRLAAGEPTSLLGCLPLALVLSASGALYVWQALDAVHTAAARRRRAAPLPPALPAALVVALLVGGGVVAKLHGLARRAEQERAAVRAQADEAIQAQALALAAEHNARVDRIQQLLRTLATERDDAARVRALQELNRFGADARGAVPTILALLRRPCSEAVFKEGTFAVMSCAGAESLPALRELQRTAGDRSRAERWTAVIEVVEACVATGER